MTGTIRLSKCVLRPIEGLCTVGPARDGEAGQSFGHTPDYRGSNAADGGGRWCGTTGSRGASYRFVRTGGSAGS